MEVKTTPLTLSALFPDLEDHKPLIISGPCSAETREQVLLSARGIAEAGVRVFRAGVWKPRTYPGGFEGVGENAWKWLVEAREETGLMIGVEVASPSHVKAALAHKVDMVWIGARTTSNPFTLDEIARELQGHDIAVMVKNPIAPDMHLWLEQYKDSIRMGLLAWLPFTEGSVRGIRPTTATSRYGRSQHG